MNQRNLEQLTQATDTEAATDTILLPHSGLQVPHTRLAVTSLQELKTFDGVAFRANLRLDGRIVGTIEDAGRGGGPMFYPRNSTVFGHNEMDAFAAQCTTRWGLHETEYVLGDLVDEYDTARTVARNAKAGKITCRLMSPMTETSNDMYCTDFATFSQLTPPRNLAASAAALGRGCQRLIATRPRQTWQVWDADAQQWTDLPNSTDETISQLDK